LATLQAFTSKPKRLHIRIKKQIAQVSHEFSFIVFAAESRPAAPSQRRISADAYNRATFYGGGEIGYTDYAVYDRL
jgi:hypothetical protein